MSTALLDAKAADGTAAGGKFLTFFLDEEEYGLVILTVQEIMGHSAEQLTIESELFGSLTVPQDVSRTNVAVARRPGVKKSHLAEAPAEAGTG